MKNNNNHIYTLYLIETPRIVGEIWLQTFYRRCAQRSGIWIKFGIWNLEKKKKCWVQQFGSYYIWRWVTSRNLRLTYFLLSPICFSNTCTMRCNFNRSLEANCMYIYIFWFILIWIYFVSGQFFFFSTPPRDCIYYPAGSQ